jgi:hypothetical protein
MLLEWASSGEVVPHAVPPMGETSHPVSVVASRNKTWSLIGATGRGSEARWDRCARFVAFSMESSERVRPIGALIEWYRPVH